MHLVYYNPFPKRSISYWGLGKYETTNLEGEVRIQFQDVKACIGYYDGKEHHSCINSTLNVKQCPYCLSKDISRVYTRMDLRGFEHLEDEIVNRPYSLYLAYFGGPTVKCGVCRAERFETRMKEQGARYFVHLMNFDNANDTYSMEKLVQHVFGVKNAMRNSTKLKVKNDLKPEILKEVLDKIKSTEPFSNYLISNPKVEKVKYNVSYNFELVTDSIDGKILGSIGSFLVFSNNGDTFGIDLKRKIGEYFKFIL